MIDREKMKKLESLFENEPWHVRYRALFNMRVINPIKRFLYKIGILTCLHEGIIGPVGAKFHTCIVCYEPVRNDSWEEERKAFDVDVNTYKCVHCGETVERQSNKKWVKSYCEDIGKDVHLQLVENEQEERNEETGGKAPEEV